MPPRAGGVSIVGVAEKTRAQLSEDLMTLLMEVILGAIEDAGLAVGEIDGIVTENYAMSSLAVDVAVMLGLSSDTFIGNFGLAGSGIVGAPLLGRLLLEAGQATNVLTFFGAKFGSERTVYEFHQEDPYKSNLELPYGFFPQAAYVAAMAQRYLWEFSYEADDLGHVAMSQRMWSSLHPDAQMRQPVGLDDYRRSALVADPFRVLDCCLMSDGAAAFVMTTPERAANLRQPAVHVASCVRAFEPVISHAALSVRPDSTTLSSRLSGPAAFARAGASPQDVDFAELYDCFSIIPVLQLEDLGFAAKGDGLRLYVDGEALPGGKLPVNTHGGLLSHSYLFGIGHLCEAVIQLRGAAGVRQVPAAQLGVVSGWAPPEHTTLLLARS